MSGFRQLAWVATTAGAIIIGMVVALTRCGDTVSETQALASTSAGADESGVQMRAAEYLGNATLRRGRNARNSATAADRATNRAPDPEASDTEQGAESATPNPAITHAGAAGGVAEAWVVAHNATKSEGASPRAAAAVGGGFGSTTARSGAAITTGVGKQGGDNARSDSRSAPGSQSRDTKAPTSCSQCEALQHDHITPGNPMSTDCPNSNLRCDALVGVTDPKSPLPGVERGVLCRQIVDCIHASHCAQLQSADCLCGVGMDPNLCFGGTLAQATGSCRDLIAAGAESEQMPELALRFTDPLYAIGAAVAVIETCDQLYCAKECL